MIAKAVAASRAVVVVFSEAANTSPQVLRELDLAVRRRIPVLPYRIVDIRPSEAFDYLLSVSQWLDAFSLEREEAHKRLVAAVGQLTKSTSEGSSAAHTDGSGFMIRAEPAASPSRRLLAFSIDASVVALPTLVFLAAMYDGVLNAYTDRMARVATWLPYQLER